MSCDPAKIVPVVIFRLPLDPLTQLIVPGMEWLARDPDALLGMAEWSWTRRKDEAFVFPDIDDAEARVIELKEEGVTHVHTATFGAAEMQDRLEARAEMRKPVRDRGFSPRPAVGPAEAFARMEREGLA